MCNCIASGENYSEFFYLFSENGCASPNNTVVIGFPPEGKICLNNPTNLTEIYVK